MHAPHAQQKRRLVLTVAASVALHAAVIAVMPGAGLQETPRRDLDVILVRPPVPEPMQQDSVRPKPIARTPEVPKSATRTVREEASRPPVPASVPDPKQPVISSSSLPSPSAYSVPQAVVEPALPAIEQRSSAEAPKDAPREMAAAAPNFNAAYLRNAPPRYPMIARRSGVEGTVKLKVLVTREGRAAEVQVEQSSGSSALDGAALEAVRNWRFVPARMGQDAVESWVLVPVVFKLQNTG